MLSVGGWESAQDAVMVMVDVAVGNSTWVDLDADIHMGVGIYATCVTECQASAAAVFLMTRESGRRSMSAGARKSPRHVKPRRPLSLARRGRRI